MIDVILQACHTYGVESLAIKRHLRQRHDLPYMAIETDYSTADLGSSAPASPPLSKCCKELA